MGFELWTVSVNKLLFVSHTYYFVLLATMRVVWLCLFGAALAGAGFLRDANKIRSGGLKLLDTLTKGKFEKFNRKTQNNDCHIVWEDHHKPHCTTEYEKICHDDTVEQCKTDYEKQCTTEYKNECSTEYSTSCEQEYKQECRNWEEEECTTVSERQCKTDYNKECTTTSERQCKTEYSQECSRTYEDQCTTVQDKECWDEPTQECKTEYDEECWTEDKQECSSQPKCHTIYEEKCSTAYRQVCDDRRKGNSRQKRFLLGGGVANHFLSKPLAKKQAIKTFGLNLVGTALPLAAGTAAGVAVSKKKLKLMAGILKLAKKGDEEPMEEDDECYQVPETHCTSHSGGRYKREAGPVYGDQHCATQYKTVCSGRGNSRGKRSSSSKHLGLLGLLGGLGGPLAGMTNPMNALSPLNPLNPLNPLRKKALFALPLLAIPKLKKKFAALWLLKSKKKNDREECY